MKNIILVDSIAVKVSVEVYKAYSKLERRERYMKELAAIQAWQYFLDCCLTLIFAQIKNIAEMKVPAIIRRGLLLLKTIVRYFD